MTFFEAEAIRSPNQNDSILLTANEISARARLQSLSGNSTRNRMKSGIMHTPATSVTPAKKAGLLYWAQRVVEECENASQDFAADPVHDLRVAIRRCRSMADGFLSVDPDPG